MPPGPHPVDPAWLGGLAGALEVIGRDIRRELGREPDLGDLLVVLASCRGSVAARALEELQLEPDMLWGVVERIRQGLGGDNQLMQSLRETRAAKEEALKEHRFNDAAKLRDKERDLTAQLRTATGPFPSDVVEEIRRRLGLPG